MDIDPRHLHYTTPSPAFPIFKAMDYAYADQLVNAGKIRLYVNSCYRRIDDQAARDALEGIGVVNCRGTEVKVQGLLPTYLWCTSQATLSPDEVGRKYGRDTVVVIEWPHILAERILEAACDAGSQWELTCKPVVYNKGVMCDLDPADLDRVDTSEVYNFQKEGIFSHEAEYRFALTDLAWGGHGEFIDLQMKSSCRKIMQIYRLEIPTRASRLQLRRARLS